MNIEVRNMWWLLLLLFKSLLRERFWWNSERMDINGVEVSATKPPCWLDWLTYFIAISTWIDICIYNIEYIKEMEGKGLLDSIFVNMDPTDKREVERKAKGLRERYQVLLLLIACLEWRSCPPRDSKRSSQNSSQSNYDEWWNLYLN